MEENLTPLHILADRFFYESALNYYAGINFLNCLSVFDFQRFIFIKCVAYSANNNLE